MNKTWKFESIFANQINSFLTLRKNEGHKISDDRFVLYDLDRYLQNIRLAEQSLSPAIIEKWLSSLGKNIGANTLRVYISHYNQFAKYLTSIGYNAFIPERPEMDRSYIPYIFSEEELIAIINASDEIVENATEYGKQTAICCTIIMRILIGCGLRVGEALSLKTKDVDTKTGVLHIHDAKGNKDRLVPMHSSLNEILQIYIESSIPQKNGMLFPSKRKNKKISSEVVRGYFNKYLELVGIQKPRKKGPGRNICVHCIRHTFAVMSFRKLHKSGEDMYDYIPVISIYMGHNNIYGTEKYLHMTTENRSDIIELMEKYNKSHGIFPEVTV